MSLLRTLRRGTAGVVGFSCAALLPLATSAVHAQEPIRIGTFLSVTGPASFLGDPELKTMQMQVEALNAAGGVLGRRLELVSYDDAGD
ncbi:MAG: ABC transporter substrate-binding protein, partial [Rubrivivax sp.]|nr:ABC transporter substrate-binding protein [Rubrivivax sp.]